jgi:hypothetical protein
MNDIHKVTSTDALVADDRGYIGEFVSEPGLSVIPPQRTRMGTEIVIMNGKLVVDFYIWNTVKLRDDKFTVEVTMLPRDTKETSLRVAQSKAFSMIGDNPAYSDQKLRRYGEPK